MASANHLLDPSIFSHLEAKIEEESRVRDALSQIVQRLDRAVATTQGLLSRVHSTPRSGYPALVAHVQDAINAQVVVIKDLNGLASQHPYYKYNQKWTRTVQASIYTTIYCAWLGGFPPETPEAPSAPEPSESHDEAPKHGQQPPRGSIGHLPSLPEVGALLHSPTALPSATGTSETSVNTNPTPAADTFHLTTEEYLLALTDLTNDLARLATNAVTLGDFQLPLLISSFLKDILAGFQLLNLKNDVLRKRADAVKYDVKRVEDVVYDLSLRGLAARPTRDTEMS